MLLKREEGKFEVVVVRTEKQEEVKAYGLELMRQEEELWKLVETDDPKAAFLERIGKGDLFLSVHEVQRVIADMAERVIQHLISMGLGEGKANEEVDLLDMLTDLMREDASSPAPFQPFRWPEPGGSISVELDFNEIDLLGFLQNSELPAGTAETLEDFRKKLRALTAAIRGQQKQERGRRRRQVIATLRGREGRQESATFRASGIVALNQERREMLAELLREDPREVKRMHLPPDILGALNNVYRANEFSRLSPYLRETIGRLWTELQTRKLVFVDEKVVDKIEWIIWLHGQLVQVQSYVNDLTFFSPEQAEEGETRPMSRREAERFAREREDFLDWQEENPDKDEPLWYPAVTEEDASPKPTRHRRIKKAKVSSYDAFAQKAQWQELRNSPYDEREYTERQRELDNLLV
jgi:hypothetical protein